MPTRGPCSAQARPSLQVIDFTKLAVNGDARRLASAIGLMSLRTLAAGGVYKRSLPTFLDTDAASATTRETVHNNATQSRQQYPAVYEFRLADAVVFGQGAVATRNSWLIGQSVYEFLADGLVPPGLSATGDEGTFALARAVTRHIEQPSLLLKRPWFRNFGHTLIDSGGILGLFRHLGLTVRSQIVLGDYAGSAEGERATEIIQLLAPGHRVLTMPQDEAWIFSDLRYVTPVQYPPMLKVPMAMAGLRDALWRCLDGTKPQGTTPRRLFVPRRYGWRRLDNHAEVAEVCRHLGFSEIYPETLNMTEQVRLFRNAEIIVGIKGAAMANILFCRRGTAVVVLSPADFPDPFFMDIAGQQQLRYGEVFGELTTDIEVGGNNFVLDGERVRQAIVRVAGPLLH